jgi:hypothetical protein
MNISEKKIVENFKQSRKELEAKTKEIEEYMKTNTTKEMKELDAAFTKYQNKVNLLQKSGEFTRLNEEAEKHHEKVQKHLKTAIKVFDSKKEEIMRGGGSDKEKNEKIDKVYDYMISKLFNPEEVKLFKAMRGKVLVALDYE